MPSVRETALLALATALTDAASSWTPMWTDDAALMWTDDDTAMWGSGTKFERNLADTTSVKSDGLMVLRDGEPGDPDATLSPLSYAYLHVADLEVFVSNPDADARAAQLDAMLTSVGRVLLEDPKLGGAVDACWPDAPAPADDPMETGKPVKAALVPITLAYVTSDPLG